MSKSKRRILHHNKSFTPLSCSREDAVISVVAAIKAHKFDKEAKNLLSLFGITDEELSEAGLTWEELKAISNYL